MTPAPHAEIECLRQFRRPIPKDATLYVTLEPCATTGRTGPCTNAIIDAGVRHVVIGTTDPNPKNARRGIAALERAGISVRSGIIERECLELNEGYNKWITSKRPFVIDVMMQNEPVPTAGHWNIMDIYSPGKKVSHVTTGGAVHA